MATINFFFKGNNNPSTINVRFKHGRKYDISKTTNLVVNPKYWNSKNGEVRQIAEFENKLNLQNDLSKLHNLIFNKFSEDFAKGELINGIWLENIIKKCFDQKEETDINYIVDYANQLLLNIDFKTQKNGKTGVSEITKNRYKNTIKRIEDFQFYKNKKYKFSEIDLKFYREFVLYFKDICNYGTNTIGKHISMLKSICNDAKENGIKVNTDIDKNEFRVLTEKTDFVTFSENEIDTIFYANFEKTPYLNNAKNWLIIGLWTGARASDLLNLTLNNINGEFIEYTSKKTNQKIMLPIHWQVKTILENLQSFPQKISTQKYNDYIKKICEELKFNELIKGKRIENISKDKKVNVFRKVNGEFKKWELVTTHIGRRTFATVHYGKLPTPIIMSATGHTTEKMLLRYIGKTAKDNAEFLQNFWNTEKQKQEKKPFLKIAK